MTYDDDYVQLQLHGTIRRATCKSLGMDWPPPERFRLGDPVFGVNYVRLRHSEITDVERADMTHVCRGAEYAVERAET